MSDVSAKANAEALRTTLLETLKQLNRAEVEEDQEREGLEPAEVLVLLRRGPIPQLPEAELENALETLLANRMIEVLDDPQYAWDRGRIVGRRFTITTTGKEYLIGQLEKTGRIE